MSKGQIFSTDLIFAVSVFLLLLAFVWYTWEDMQYQIDRKLEISEMQHYALVISDALVMTSGSPHNWTDDPTSVESIGLAKLPREISTERFAALKSLDYSIQREKVGVGRFDFWLAVKGANGAVINWTGLAPAGDMQVGVERAVTLDGEPRVMNLVIWENYYRESIPYANYHTL